MSPFLAVAVVRYRTKLSLSADCGVSRLSLRRWHRKGHDPAQATSNSPPPHPVFVCVPFMLVIFSLPADCEWAEKIWQPVVSISSGGHPECSADLLEI